MLLLTENEKPRWQQRGDGDYFVIFSRISPE